MRQQLELNGGLMLAMLCGGLLLVPLGGWMPLLAIAAVCGTSMYVASKFNSRH